MSALDEIAKMQARLEEIELAILELKASTDEQIEALEEEAEIITAKVGLAVGATNEMQKKIDTREEEMQKAFNSLFVRLEGTGQITELLPELKTFAIESSLEIPNAYNESPPKEESHEEVA